MVIKFYGVRLINKFFKIMKEKLRHFYEFSFKKGSSYRKKSEK